MSDSKMCTKCMTDKPIGEFHTKGKGRRNAWCAGCMRDYLRDHYANNKAAYYIKKMAHREALSQRIEQEKRVRRCCYVCDESRPATFDFHHRDPELKEASIGSIPGLGWSLENLEQELAKCVLLCANCHRQHHHEEKNPPGLLMREKTIKEQIEEKEKSVDRILENLLALSD